MAERRKKKSDGFPLHASALLLSQAGDRFVCCVIVGAASNISSLPSAQFQLSKVDFVCPFGSCWPRPEGRALPGVPAPPRSGCAVCAGPATKQGIDNHSD